MDIVGFLYVSLGSSTVQLHDSLGSKRTCTCSKAGFSSQNGNHAWGVYYQRVALYCAFFFWGGGEQKDLVQRIFIKKCFLFMMGSVCHVKCFTTGWQTFHWWRRGWNGGVEVAETLVKRLQCCGFQSTGKAMGHVWMLVEDMSRNKCFFQVHISHVLHFISICDLFTDSALYLQPK
jgi:hypothetical protein